MISADLANMEEEFPTRRDIPSPHLARFLRRDSCRRVWLVPAAGCPCLIVVEYGCQSQRSGQPRVEIFPDRASIFVVLFAFLPENGYHHVVSFRAIFDTL